MMLGLPWRPQDFGDLESLDHLCIELLTWKETSLREKSVLPSKKLIGVGDLEPIDIIHGESDFEVSPADFQLSLCSFSSPLKWF